MLRKIKLILLIAIIIVLVFGIYFISAVSAPASDEAKLIYFKVESGQTVKQISQSLKDQGLIKNKFIFETYVKWKKAQAKLLAGEHKLSQDMSVKEVTQSLTTGNSVDNEKTITIIEGWRIDEMGEYLEEQRLVTKEDFISSAKMIDWRDKYDFLRQVPADTLEGFLFPDTYQVFTDATANEIVGKILDNFNQKFRDEIRNEINRQNKSIFEVVNLAAIVEREAMTKEDKRMVADVFIKRLALNMPLQSDATVNYVTGKSELQPSYDDLEVDSLYNTYKYAGLPPGPIANPGLIALEAVVWPQQNNYYFFLMGTDGNTYYAETFDQHNENKRRYLD